MKYRLALGVAVLGMGAGIQAGTITYTWNFDNPTGTLGTSQTYTSTNNGGAPNITITAYGLGGCTVNDSKASGCSATDLYGKNAGGSEQGLGIANDPSGDHEIYDGTFVQLDLTNLFHAIAPVAGSITIDSVQSNEYFTFWLNSTQGQPGSYLYQGTSSGSSAVVTLSGNNPGSNLGGDLFFSVGAGEGNILLSTISASVNAPEPASFALVGLALAGVGIARRKRGLRNR